MELSMNTHKVKWGRVIWNILFNKGFRFSLSEVIFYGLLNARENRGTHASGVVMFEGRGFTDQIIKEK